MRGLHSRGLVLLSFCVAAASGGVLYVDSATGEISSSENAERQQQQQQQHSAQRFRTDANYSASAAAASPANETARAAAAMALSGGMSLLLGPCCDDVSCAAGTSEYANCDALYDCSSVSCPAEPTDAASLLALGFSVPGDSCGMRAAPGQVCSCVCKCVCVYPSTRVLWLDVAPPPKVPAVAATSEQPGGRPAGGLADEPAAIGAAAGEL